MTIGLSAQKWLDEKECWDKWIELGSLESVRRYYQKNGVLNNRTGDPPTQSAIQKAAYRWMLGNIHEARKQVEHEWQKDGRILTEDEWKKFLFRVVKTTYYQTPVKLEKFIVGYGLQSYVY